MHNKKYTKYVDINHVILKEKILRPAIQYLNEICPLSKKVWPPLVYITMCVKDCGFHNQNIDVIILYACLVGWLKYSPVEIQKN